MRKYGLGTVFALAAGLMAPLDYGAAQPAHDQISIVIPSVQKGTTNLSDADAARISYILALSIKRHFLRAEGVGRSAVVTVPALLGDNKPSAIGKLTRINGAQIALSMKAFRQLKGTLIDIVMVIPERYQDFRTDPVEVLGFDFDGSHLSLDIPNRYMTFPSVFLSDDIINMYRADTYRKLCPIDRCETEQTPKITGKCLVLGADIQYATPLRYYELGKTDAVIRLNDACYLQKLPANDPISEPVIDFVTGVQRFFAGDKTGAKERMTAVINSTLGRKSSVLLQAYLYLVRISIQTNNVNDAKKYMGLAMSINKRDSNVLETGRFLDFWVLTRSVQSRSTDAKMLLASIENDLGEEPEIIRKPYKALLDRLRVRVRKGD